MAEYISIAEATQKLGFSTSTQLINFLLKKKIGIFYFDPEGSLAEVLVLDDLIKPTLQKVLCGIHASRSKEKELEQFLGLERMSNKRIARIKIAQHLKAEISENENKLISDYANRNSKFVTPLISHLKRVSIKKLVIKISDFKYVYGKFRYKVQFNEKQKTVSIDRSVYNLGPIQFLVAKAIYSLAIDSKRIRKKDIEAFIGESIPSNKGIPTSFVRSKLAENSQKEFFSRFIIYDKKTLSYKFKYINHKYIQ